MNSQQENSPASWLRRLFAGIIVVIGIIRMSSKGNMTLTDIALVFTGCIMLAWAAWQEVRKFVKNQ